ncbi:hypothetical protein AVEN_157425-1 [Araneus ventricosus]|uniref:Uncharacterized protein n=1 Tax=Araneus ventricosus TaxID=182803 RepID=A0A4Y2SVU7_ARAVE|nr:hypothetical protein AVEN_157425-1 [Araneus ventricosus]
MLWVNTRVYTQKLFTYPLGIYPPHITGLYENITPDAYTRSFKAAIAHEQKFCADGSKKDECTRMKNLMGCHFGYLDQLNQEGKCQIDA